MTIRLTALHLPGQHGVEPATVIQGGQSIHDGVAFVVQIGGVALTQTLSQDG